MKIEWLGHSSFLLTFSSGFRVITDPYESGSYDGAVGYGKIDLEADAVTVSHSHADHNASAEVRGDFKLITTTSPCDLSEGLKVSGFETYHDTSFGKDRGENIIFKFEGDGLTILHFGDLGHSLSDDLIKRLGRVDVVLIPVGGHFTIDQAAAWDIINKLSPNVIIPMHFKTEKLNFPIAGVGEFLSGTSSVNHVDFLEITSDTLPSSPSVYVLKHLR
ncbi:MAG TPA: MBL fold metallo-hydrolase [Firmicutes bacterium]|nr:MBL fold metallo-hydrolase [Bacillota bacterium]